MSPSVPGLASFPVPFTALADLQPPAIHLFPDEVHLWLGHTAISLARLSQYERVLNDEEQAHAGRFASAGGRQRFVIARGLLRLLLADQLNASPGSLNFDFGPHGKPSLGGAHRDVPLHFNVSHSGSWVLIGISTGPEIGVDIESANDRRPWQRIAERMFGPQELLLMNQGGDAALARFYRIWSAREAYLKAIGIGLAGLQKQDIVAGDTGAISPENATSPWVAYLLTVPDAPANGPVGAVALSSAPCQLKAWRI